MAAIVDICNQALSHIGSDAIVAAIDPPDGSVEAGHCARFYPLARTELLDAYHWSFSRKRATLAVTTNPSTVWAYAYTVPSDCLRARRVLDALSLTRERGSADFDLEGDLLLTDEAEAVLVYTNDVTDPSKFTPSFCTALGYLIASFLAGPLIKGNEGARTGVTLRKAAQMVASSAITADANASAEPASNTPDSIAARA